MPTVGRMGKAIDTPKGNQEEATREAREKPGGSEASVSWRNLRSWRARRGRWSTRRILHRVLFLPPYSVKAITAPPANRRESTLCMHRM